MFTLSVWYNTKVAFKNYLYVKDNKMICKLKSNTANSYYTEFCIKFS